MSQLLPYLEITHPDRTKQTVSLVSSTIKIGRLEGNDVVLADDKVSRLHCIIERSSGGYWEVKDCGSVNGTSLNRNEQYIELGSLSDRKEFLNVDDEICILDWRLIFKDPNQTVRAGTLTENSKFKNKPQTPALKDGFVFCISQQKLYSIKQGQRKSIELSPQIRELVKYLMQQNQDCGKPVLCKYKEIAFSLWGDIDRPETHRPDDWKGSIIGLANGLRKIIGSENLETVKNEGYILMLDIPQES
jgi:hypothetical protein